jgi:hypothetical protein
MKRTIPLILVLTLALIVSACNFPFATSSDDALATSVAETVEAMEDHVVKPTLAPLPTAVPPTATAPVVDEDEDDDHVVDDEDDEVQCLWATFISETIPDGTNFSPGEHFTKTWTLRNDGYCDWNTDYQIAFKSGDQMSGPDAQDITKETDPDEKITISVDLVAPSDEGTYTGYWQMRTHEGVNFGKVSVSIDVE